MSATYDAIDRLVDEDPIALRDLAWQLLREQDEERTQRDAAVEALEALVAGGILTDAAYADLWPLLRATLERTAHPGTSRIC